jgi:hypothetical protein
MISIDLLLLQRTKTHPTTYLLDRYLRIVSLRLAPALPWSPSHKDTDTDTDTDTAAMPARTRAVSDASDGAAAPAPAPASSSPKSAPVTPVRKAKPKAVQKESIFLKVPLVVYQSVLVTAVLLLAAAAYLVYTRFGIGEPFPVAAVEWAEADTHFTVLQPMAQLPVPPGNVAVSGTGRVFFTFHPEYNPQGTKIAELTFIRERRNSFRQFPSAAFQASCITCLALRVDMQERLWLLDHAGYGLQAAPRLFAFQLLQNDTHKDRLLFQHDFPSDAAGMGSFLNDFNVDAAGEFVYISDTSMLRGDPGLVVFDVARQTSTRILSSHPSMFGQSAFFDVVETTVKLPGPFGFRINVDSIALDRVQGRWLYYGAMTSTSLFVLPVEAIHHYLATVRESGRGSQSEVEAAAKLEAAVMVAIDGEKPVTDGISTDPMGNIYMTAVDLSAIVVAVAQRKPEKELQYSTPPKFKMRKLVQSDDHLRWPDGMSFGPKGLYITESALHLKLMGLDLKGAAPFHIYKIAFETIQGMQPDAPYSNATRLPFHGQ